MKIYDFENGYDEAIKYLKWLNNTADKSVVYICHVYVYSTNGEFSFTIDGRNTHIATNDTCVMVKNYIDDELSYMDVVDIASVVAIRYAFVCTKR